MHGYRRTVKASRRRSQNPDRRRSREGLSGVASGAKTDRAQLGRLLDALAPGDVLTVTRLDRLARSTCDLLNTLAAITGKAAGFRSATDRSPIERPISRAWKCGKTALLVEYAHRETAPSSAADAV
jgi:hypothetical protein